MDGKIPRIIHYCWFGKGEKSELIHKCIKSWKKFMPDYQYIEWNEDNFNISYNRYTLEAYRQNKYAFVSDVARLYALQQSGGIYLDTDMELLNSLDKFLYHGCFFGFESNDRVNGAIIASVPNHPMINELIGLYSKECFKVSENEYNSKTIVDRITQVLLSHHLVLDGSYQTIMDNVSVYPQEYFYPIDYSIHKMKITPNTYTIHHFIGSWVDKRMKFGMALKVSIKRIIHAVFGDKILQIVTKTYNKRFKK